jgi:hypothetical protein
MAAVDNCVHNAGLAMELGTITRYDYVQSISFRPKLFWIQFEVEVCVRSQFQASDPPLQTHAHMHTHTF